MYRKTAKSRGVMFYVWQDYYHGGIRGVFSAKKYARGGEFLDICRDHLDYYYDSFNSAALGLFQSDMPIHLDGLHLL